MNELPRRASVAALYAIVALTVSTGSALAAADLIDTCDTTDGFFLFPGEPSVAAVAAADGVVGIRKTGAGDAFTRWSTSPLKKIPLDDQRRWLSIAFGDFKTRGTEAVVHAAFFEGTKRRGMAELGKVQGGPGAIVVDLIDLASRKAPGATSFWLFIRHSKDPKGIIRIDEIRLGSHRHDPDISARAPTPTPPTETPPAPVERVTVSVETGDIVPVVTPGNEDKVALVLANPSEHPIELDVELTIDDYYHRTRTIARRVTVEGGGSQRIAPLFDGRLLGVYMIGYRLADTVTGERAEGITSFCYMRPAGPTPFRREGFLFSVNGGVEGSLSEQDLRRGARMISLAGIKVMRSSLVWEALAYHGRDRIDTKKLDAYGRMIDVLKEHGVELQVLLGYNVPWNVPKEVKATGNRGDWQFYPPHKVGRDHWLEYVDTMLDRFSDRVRFWEVWNEADLWDFWRGTSDEYIAFLRLTYEAIKAHDPNMQVMTSGFALLDGHGGHREDGFQEKVATRGRPWYDILAHHRHGRTDAFYVEVDGKLGPIRAKIDPPAPLWFNETAVASPRDGYRYQAAALSRKLLFAWSRGAMGYTWYQMRSGTLRLDTRRKWGLTSGDLEPKYVYAAYNTIVQLLDDKEFDARLDRGVDRYGFVFRPREGGGEYVVALWDESEKLPEQPIAFDVGDDEGVEVFEVDLMGNRAPRVVVDGLAVVHSSQYTRFMLVRNAARAPRMAGTLVEMAGPLPVATPGRPYEVAVTLHNPFDRDQGMLLVWKDSPSAAWGPIAAAAVPAKSTAELTFALPVPDGFRLPYGDLHQMRLGYAVLGAQWGGSIAVPLEPAVLVPSGAMDGREADIVLEDYRYVTNRHEHAPQRAHLTWQGVEDLSFRVWLQPERESLRMRVDVSDDVHAPNPAKFDDGDCLGIVLNLPSAQTSYAIYVARTADGKSLTRVYRAPEGTIAPDDVRLRTSPRDGGMRYELALPRNRMGLTDEVLAGGIRLNVIAIDRDDGPREGWIQVAPAKQHWAPNWDASMFSTVVFETAKE